MSKGNGFISALDIDLEDDTEQPAYSAPPGALTWRSALERKRVLRVWRRVVLTRFGERPRALRVAWVLEGLFNTKTGHAFPSNEYLRDETGMSVSDVQKGLHDLDGEVIIRVVERARNTKRTLWPKRVLDVAVVATSRDSHDVATHNMRRTTRTPRTQRAAAHAAAKLREHREARASGEAARLAERPREQASPSAAASTERGKPPADGEPPAMR
jgi:hypothetical protein